MNNLNVTFSRINKEAKETLKGNWSIAILVSLVFSMIYNAPNQIAINLNIPIALLFLIHLLTLFIAPIEVGLNRVFLDFSEQKNTNIDRLFYPFKTGRYARSLGAILLRSIYIGLLIMLFIIPGIMYLYSTALVPIMLADKKYDKLSASQLLKVSKLYMQGYRFKLFLIELRYVWYYGLLLGASSVLIQLDYDLLGYTLLGVVTLFYTFKTMPLLREATIMFYKTVISVDKVIGETTYQSESLIDYLEDDPLAESDDDPFFKT